MRILNLKKAIGDFTLSIDNLYLEPAKIHGLVGHNGAGKSILLKLIMGIIEPDRTNPENLFRLLQTSKIILKNMQKQHLLNAPPVRFQYQNFPQEA